MKYQGEELVRVRSESELRAGMMLVITGCRVCGHTEGVFLIRLTVPPKYWDVVGGCGRSISTDDLQTIFNDRKFFSFTTQISEGRVWRLRDEQKTNEKTRTREVEGQR